MKEFNTCPTCGSSKTELQPDPIDGRQDIFYICKGAVTYSLENEEDFEDTGACENKIEWDHIYVDYGGEFDDNAKLVDGRFYGWMEFQFYKSAHTMKWMMKNPTKTPLDIDCIDEYFDNKELYIKKMRNFKGELPELGMPIINEAKEIVVKTYVVDTWLGELVMEKIDRIEHDGFEKLIFKVLNSKDEPTRVGGYIVENNQIGGGDSSVDFYDREIIEIILRNEH